MALDSNTIIQITVVVKDIQKTAANMAKLFGTELPEIFNMSKLGKTYAEYLGNATETDIQIANFPMGSVTLELLQPDDKPSTFKTFLEEKGEGVHHIGIMVKDREAALKTVKENGAAIRYWGTYPGGVYDIADTRALLGVLLNIKHEE
jgi:methylmalonyl-CoA/ethylmalonyl-CoA epimerase